MTSQAKVGTGVVLTLEDNGTPTEIAEIRKISFNEEAEMIDVTTLGSGGVKEFIQGDRSIGVIKLGVYFINDEMQQLVRDNFRSKTKGAFAIDFSGAGIDDENLIEFDAFVKSRGFEIAPGDPLMLQLDLQVTGDWTWGTAS